MAENENKGGGDFGKHPDFEGEGQATPPQFSGDANMENPGATLDDAEGEFKRIKPLIKRLLDDITELARIAKVK